MSNYKYPTPQLLLKAICDAIREKTGSNNKIIHQNIPDELDNIIIDEEEYKMAAQELLNVMYGEEMEILDSKYILSIPKERFCYNNKITTVNLHKCSSIGDSAFLGCTSLTTIDLQECTSIGDQAFNSCTNLTTINLPECTSIEYFAFYNCTSLTTIDLPKCTSIGGGAFNSCTNLTTINLPKCIVIDSGPHHTAGTINCLNLTTINLPKCISIKDNVFQSCTSLTTINLPKCTSIGDYAFVNCNLQIIILGADQIVDISSFTFIYEPSINNGTGYIYVPDNLVDSYKTATKWSTYANQIKPISELPSNLKEEYGYV